MTERNLIVVDTETTGLRAGEHVIVELAAINYTTGDRIYIVPPVTPNDLGTADPKAMQVNRYYERGLWERTHRGNELHSLLDQLAEWLHCNTIGGSNPAFDADMIITLFRHNEDPDLGGWYPEWHHRKADISAMTAGALGLPPTDLPGLAKCCELLGIENADEHTAMGDAEATLRCFKALEARA